MDLEPTALVLVESTRHDDQPALRRARITARSDELVGVAVEQGRLDESETMINSALADFRGARHLVGAAASRLTHGRLLARLGRTSEAERQFQRAHAVAESATAN